jgi:hypothetical protein
MTKSKFWRIVLFLVVFAGAWAIVHDGVIAFFITVIAYKFDDMVQVHNKTT